MKKTILALTVFILSVGFAFGADSAYELGKAACKQGNCDEALEQFSIAIKENPNDANAYGYRGYIYYERNEYDKALADYTRAIEIEPNDASIYHMRAKIYENLREYEKALADCAHVIRLVPDDPDAYEIRAKVYESMGEYAKAIADYAEAGKLQPRDDENHYVQVVEKFDKLDAQEKAKYEQEFRQAAIAVRKNPKDANAYLARAEAHSRLGGNVWSIIEDYKQAIELKPDFF
jgi:tetratricopeptide (TPR) repeat protein